MTTPTFKHPKDFTAEEWKAGIESGKKKLIEANKMFGISDEVSAQAVPPVANPQLTWSIYTSNTGSEKSLRSSHDESFTPRLEMHFEVKYYYSYFVLNTGGQPTDNKGWQLVDILQSPTDAKRVAELNLKRYQDTFVVETKRAKGLWDTELGNYPSS